MRSPQHVLYDLGMERDDKVINAMEEYAVESVKGMNHLLDKKKIELEKSEKLNNQLSTLCEDVYFHRINSSEFRLKIAILLDIPF